MLKESVNKIYINSGNEDILNLITLDDSTILDVGCGNGALASILTSKGHNIDGITISPEEYAAAKKHTRNIFICDLENGLPDQALELKYDFVICSHVLEHIVYPEKLLNGIFRVLKPGGYLLVALPNIMHYKSRIKLANGKFDYQDAGIWDNTHVKWYTFDTAKKLLLEHGFTIELASVTGELPLNSLFSKILSEKIRKKIYGLLTKISKGLFGYQLLLKARKP